MSDVFILGSGFSKAIYSEMPTIAELSTEVMSSLNRGGQPIPPALAKLGNNIELWMTYLSQRQPWLEIYEQDYNRSLVGRIREEITSIIDNRISRATKSAAPEWLIELIRAWHDRRASVMTLNYDTLVERATRELKVAEKVPRLMAENLYPPYFSNIRSRSGGAMWGTEPMKTFSYLKLHGSTNWYYSGRDDFYGETIFYSDVPPLGEDLSEIEQSLRRFSQDKEALIIPPVTEKTTYFNNETVRGLWRDAGLALKKATRVFVLGYSLPISDLGMSFFLTENQPSQATPFFVVDINERVSTRYRSVLPDADVRTDFAGKENAVNDFARQYGNMP